TGDGTTTRPGEGTSTTEPCSEGTIGRDATTSRLSSLQNRCFIAPPLDLSNADDELLYRLVNNVIDAGTSEARRQAASTLTDHINSLSPAKLNSLKSNFSAKSL